MSRKTLDNIPEISHDHSAWADLFDETKAEILTSRELSDEDKLRLAELDGLSESEWQPGACSGKPISQTIIEDRGER
jgi:hypothetical protein